MPQWLLDLIAKYTKDGVLDTEGLTAEINSEFPKNAVPKDVFNKLNDTKKDLEQQIKDRDKQLSDLGAKVKDNEELSKQIKDLQDTNEKTKESYEGRIKDMTIDSAIKAKLTDTKYPELLTGKFDRSKLTVNTDGAVLGIDEQLKEMKETYKDLFVPGLSGKEPNNNRKPGSGVKNPWSKEHYNLTEQAKLLKENPELAEQLKNSI